MTASSDKSCLHQLIRQIVCEEIAKESARQTPPLQAPPQPEITVASVAEVVRHKLRQVFASPEPCSEVSHQPHAYSYADAVPRPLFVEVSYQLNACSYADPVCGSLSMPVPQYHQPPPIAAWAPQDPVRRPPLLISGVPQITVLCATVLGSQDIFIVFARIGQLDTGEVHLALLAAFDESLMKAVPPLTMTFAGRQESSSNLRTRSPSPGRFSSPNRQSFADVIIGQSPSPRRGN